MGHKITWKKKREKVKEDLHWGCTISLTFSPLFIVLIALGNAGQRWPKKANSSCFLSFLQLGVLFCWWMGTLAGFHVITRSNSELQLQINVLQITIFNMKLHSLFGRFCNDSFIIKNCNILHWKKRTNGTSFFHKENNKCSTQ